MAEKQEPYVTHEEHQEIIDEYRALAARNWGRINSFANITTWILVALVVIQLILGAVSIALVGKTNQLGRDNSNAIVQINKEAQTRVDQSCTKSEKDYARQVENLKLTYQYLVGLSPAQKRESLNAAILKQLPKTEADVKGAIPPKFCNEKGVGLPNPPPSIPARPAELR